MNSINFVFCFNIWIFSSFLFIKSSKWIDISSKFTYMQHGNYLFPLCKLYNKNSEKLVKASPCCYDQFIHIIWRQNYGRTHVGFTAFAAAFAVCTVCPYHIIQFIESAVGYLLQRSFPKHAFSPISFNSLPFFQAEYKRAASRPRKPPRLHLF